MKITGEYIPHIENALGLELYDHQVNYLLDKGELLSGRRTGKTLAYCVKLALSDGEPLNMKKPEDFSDGWALGNRITYSRDFFRREFMRIRNMLIDYGFKVREIKC